MTWSGAADQESSVLMTRAVVATSFCFCSRIHFLAAVRGGLTRGRLVSHSHISALIQHMCHVLWEEEQQLV